MSPLYSIHRRPDLIEIPGLGLSSGGRFYPSEKEAEIMAFLQDEEEALRAQYSPSTLAIRPLSSGRWAIFPLNRVTILSELDPDVIRDLSQQNLQRVMTRLKDLASPAAPRKLVSKTDQRIEDLF